VRNPMRLSASPAESHAAPPLLGQHTGEVLREVLGRSDSDIAALRSQGVV